MGRGNWDFVDYKDGNLTLKWPTDNFWGRKLEHTFNSVGPNDIQILNAQEVLEKMALIFKKSQDIARMKLEIATAEMTPPQNILPFWQQSY